MLIYLVFLAVGLLAYWPVMRAGFYGDDWMFLTVVSQAPNALVAFAPLNQRFTRPVSVLTYYWTYHLFGLWTYPAHLFIVLLHVLNTCLVHQLALRLAPPPNRLIAFGAGLVFLVFAGHSEAVSWTAGMADVVATAFLLGSMLLLGRALEAKNAARPLLLAILVGAGGLLGKETAMVVPALGVAYGLLPSGSATLTRTRLWRTAIFAVSTGLVMIGYLAFRSVRFGSEFGSTLGGYAGLGTSQGQFLSVFRMFLLRLMIPPGRRIAAGLWTHHLDLVLLAVGVAGIVFVLRRDVRSRTGLGFCVAALLITLAPALPLSISLVNSLSERYIYAASAFSAILVVWVAARVLRHRALVVVAIVLLAGANLRSLERANRRWVDGPALFQTVVDGLVTLQHRHDPEARALILLLNMPDNLDRPYVDGAGVLPALRLLTPSIANADGRLRIIGMHSADLRSGPVRVVPRGRAFTVDVGEDTVVPGWAKDTEDYIVAPHGLHHYTVTIRPTKRRALVAAVSNGQVRLVAQLNGVPFGSIDLPSGDTMCDGATTRFAGWALDDEGVEDVVLVRERLEAERSGEPLVPIGTATWHTGRRPDVEAAFHDYPAADRAEWDFELPCANVRQARAPLRIRVVARDRHDQRTELGTRTVR